ncbi:putative receptor protein kinase ZmPK1 [Syzygium oleosum]|uniref:putative receptor protein kinase ZmPK1 n=1 Tax=Syzygium oleosum TaxID=219896 RepID=UPI0011D281DE|nr:putative receptor protein kinase ZmPK1 [Syzygium oleosum]
MNAMKNPLLLLCFSLVLSFSLTSSVRLTLREGSSLSVDKPDDTLTSEDGAFTAGFYPVGENAYCFAIWFTKPSCSIHNCTVVWMANRDQPVNGRSSKLSLRKNGDLVLVEADRTVVWATSTGSSSGSSMKLLQLLDTGNLVLRDKQHDISWQSFDSPTNTLLPLQKLTGNTPLVSSRSKNNFSSGYYRLYFDNDNLLRLLFDGPKVTSVYWPDPWLSSLDTGRAPYNDSRVAMLDPYGNFTSSDNLKFLTSDYGAKVQRRLTVDYDGNVRVYSRSEGEEWLVSWQAKSDPCTIHGICGNNSMCTYHPREGRSCICAPGYERENLFDWTRGCKAKFNSFCDSKVETELVELPHADFYGYDIGYFPSYTLEMCKKLCLDLCNCLGIQFKDYKCFPKLLLLNGHYSPGVAGGIHFKLPKSNLSSYKIPRIEYAALQCPANEILLPRTYVKRKESLAIKILLIFVGAIAGMEAIVVLMVWCFLYATRREKGGAHIDGYHAGPTGFRRFTYDELKKATRNFSEEIGRGNGGNVYKAVLSDCRVAAVKRLHEANQGENEFLAEVSTIGNLNHMNLIDMWGYCIEGKHRLLIYEFMEHGSLAENLSSPTELDWSKRFEIAVGSARGLAYLHEECLEWVLHCDVKPQNILLDSVYQPKVADFGLSKILKREGLKNSSFSRIRGTRGYMAPEWVYNMPITSKVDVYSYGIVLLELVTGWSPTGGLANTESGDENGSKRLTSWVRERKRTGVPMETWIKEIVDPRLTGEYDIRKIEVLVAVALQCVEEDRDARPTMNQVVEKLLRSGDEDEDETILV